MRFLPDAVKKMLASQNVKFYIIDAYKLAREIGEVQADLDDHAVRVLQAERADHALREGPEAR
ncbi:MAG: hypothetical protein MZU97_24455 [Bacillus subtilis]|nr:hypothetical protein [Bacillus subtilis]